ncbi:MAG: NAD(P)-dependent oxidoreductase [Spirochaetes bacterium]|nr:NAD(P)-dependent oxidoreductase [Spirochaetota bacterium]
MDTIGFIGLGVMGGSMASHLLAAGYKLLVNTRSPVKAAMLLETGAVWRESAAHVASSCAVVITMVGYPAEVEGLYFGPGGLIENARPGTILIDMSTSSPDLAARIYKTAAARGIRALDAPVSGGDLGAKNATLTIMAGGDSEVFEQIRPLFEAMGKTIILQGGPGAGQHTKMANQIAIAGSLLGAVESIIYAEKAGLDPSKVLVSISSGSAGSWQLTNNGQKILSEDFSPGFYVKHFRKDLGIALDSARRLGADLPLLALAERLFATLESKGLGDLGTQVLYKLYAGGHE